MSHSGSHESCLAPALLTQNRDALYSLLPEILAPGVLVYINLTIFNLVMALGCISQESLARSHGSGNGNCVDQFHDNISNNSSSRHRVASHIPWVVIRLWMVNPKKPTAVISGTEGGFDEQGDGKDCSDGMIPIVFSPTPMVRPHHLIQVQRSNDSI